MKKILNVILLFFTLNVYSQDSLKWNFKYSGYVDLKTINYLAVDKLLIFLIMVLGRIVLEILGKDTVME